MAVVHVLNCTNGTKLRKAAHICYIVSQIPVKSFINKIR